MLLFSHRFVSALSILFVGLVLSCNLATKKNLRTNRGDGKNLFIESSVQMARTTTQIDALVRFNTIKPVNCELTYWKQELGESVPVTGSVIKGCSNSQATTEFVESIGGLDRISIYFVQVAAWEQGSDRSKSLKLLIREQKDSLVPEEIMVGRFNVPLRTLDVYRGNRGKKSPDDLLDELRKRERKCSKGIALQTPDSELPVDNFVKIESLVTKGLLVGNAAPNEGNSARLQVVDPSPFKVSDYEFQYKILNKSAKLTGSGVSTLSSARAVSEATITFPEPQLTIAERTTIQLNKTRPFRFEWVLQQAENSGYVTVQLGYPGQNNSVFCVFDAKAGFGEISPEILKDIPSGKHDMAISAVSFRLNSVDTNNLLPWLIGFHDWRVARFQVL